MLLWQKGHSLCLYSLLRRISLGLRVAHFAIGQPLAETTVALEVIMARRIVQIAACGVDNVSSTQCAYMVLALCDDGTLWEQRNTSSAWQCLFSIPDAPKPVEAPSASANTQNAPCPKCVNWGRIPPFTNYCMSCGRKLPEHGACL